MVMKDLLSRTWQLLQTNWILLTVVIAETLVMLIFKGGQVGMSPNLMLEMAVFFFHLAVLGGWLYQMKAVVLRENHRANWDDFFNGVAKYFSPLLGGGAMFLVICMVGLLLSVALATAVNGELNQPLIEKLSQLMQQNKTGEIEKILTAQSAELAQLERWMLTMLGGLLVLGIYCLSLCFWSHWCVLGDTGWSLAWTNSQQTLRKHWKPLLGLGLIWILPTGLMTIMLYSGIQPLALMAMLLGLIVKTYFTLLFVQFLVLAEPERVAPLPKEVPQT